MTTKLHEWVCFVQIECEVIRNEDNEFLFKFKFDDDEANMDALVVTKWDTRTTICKHCLGQLEEVFGEPCEVNSHSS